MAKKKPSKSQEWQGKIKTIKALVKKQLKSMSTSHSRVLKSLPYKAREITVGELMDKYQGNLTLLTESTSEKRRITYIT